MKTKLIFLSALLCVMPLAAQNKSDSESKTAADNFDPFAPQPEPKTHKLVQIQFYAGDQEAWADPQSQFHFHILEIFAQVQIQYRVDEKGNLVEREKRLDDPRSGVPRPTGARANSAPDVPTREQFIAALKAGNILIVRMPPELTSDGESGTRTKLYITDTVYSVRWQRPTKK